MSNIPGKSNELPSSTMRRLTSDEYSLPQKVKLDYSNVFSTEKTAEMKKFNRYVLLTIINETKNHLTILKNINQQNLEDTPPTVLEYKTITERYVGTGNHADYRINASNDNFDKIARDIGMIHLMLMNTCRELYYRGTYEVLKKYINNIDQMYHDDEEMLRQERSNGEMIEKITIQYEQERLDSVHTIDETNNRIQKLRFDVEDVYVYGDHEVGYYGKWEKARYINKLPPK